MSIVVTTPTGNVGSRVVQLLVQAGVRPTVLLRDPAKLPSDIAAHVDTRPGDLRDADFVRTATREAEVLFWVDPTDFTVDDPNAASARLGGVVADAVVANAIPRVVFQSSVGAEKRHGVGLIDGLARVEEALDATGASVLHLRCGYFFTNLLGSLEGLKGGVLSTAMPADKPMPWVDPRDIGDIVASRLLARGWTGREVHGVHGPEDLSFAEVAGTVADVTGRPISLNVVADQDERDALLAVGMSPTAADGVVGMTRGLRDDFVPEQERSVLSTTPTTLAAWACQHLRPLLAPEARGR
jgi:uncharacterized protein YbjT (DUF2867 family)